MIRGASPFVTPLPNADNDFVRDELLASATWAGSEDDAPTEVIGSSTGVALTTDTGNDTAGRPAPATVHRITALTQRYLRAPVPAWPMSTPPTFIDIEHLSELSAICASSREKDTFWK
jgi:hypothetical protein